MAIIKNVNATPENQLPMYTGYLDEETHIHVIDGNSEMGKGIYHYSTLAGCSIFIKADGTVMTDVHGTCGEFCKHCEKICYARRYTMRNHIGCMPAYIDNTLLLRGDRDKFFRELEDFFYYNVVSVFRAHVSGEFLDYDHLKRFLELAARHPETQFYFYTEAEIFVDKAEDEGLLPLKNVVPWISVPTCEMDRPNPRNHRRAYIDDGKHPDPRLKNVFHCPKNTKDGKKTGKTCSVCKTCPYGRAGGKGKEIMEVALWKH